MVAAFMVLIIAVYNISLCSSYIINGTTPYGATPSPAVYICQDQCPRNCAPECSPSCCNGVSAKNDILSDLAPHTPSETEVVYPGQVQRPDNSYATARPTWNNPPGCGDKVVENTPAQRQASSKPEMMIQSIEESDTEECEDKGFDSPTDNSEDPPGTITIPLPPTLYNPPKPGEQPTELQLPAFSLPADILNGKFPKESVTLEPIVAKAAPVITPAPYVPPHQPPPPPPPPPPPRPPPPPPTPVPVPTALGGLVYPKLPPVTISEIPIKKKPNLLPVVAPHVPLINKPPPAPGFNIVPESPLILKPPTLQYPNSAPVRLAPVPPVHTPSLLATQPAVTPPASAETQICGSSKSLSPSETAVNLQRCDDCEDCEECEYECMVNDMKQALDTKYPQIPAKKREKVMKAYKKRKGRKGKGKKGKGKRVR